MTNKSNVFSTGGGGNFFEVSVQTAFVITMLLNGSVPTLPEGNIISIRLQSKFKTDDFLLILKTPNGEEYKFLAQIKHTLAFTSQNELFQEVIKSFWIDYKNEELFNRGKDKLALIVGGLNDIQRNHFKPILDWASAKSNVDEFISELDTSTHKQKAFETFKTILKKIADDPDLITDSEVWNFLKHVEILDYDFGSGASGDYNIFKTLISLAKRENIQSSPEEIWGNVFQSVSQKNSQGATIEINSLEDEFDYFKPDFRSTISNSLDRLINESQLLFDRIDNTIGGVHISRTEVLSKISNIIDDHQIVIFSGDAGVGKSAFAKDVLLSIENTCVFAFVADQFLRSRLSNTLSEMRISEDITKLFSRFALIPNKIIYIDSLEKLLEGEAEAFRELITILKKNNDIKLVMTCRSYALQSLVFEYIEDFENKREINIPNFSDNEIEQVKEQIPELVPLLDNKKIFLLLKKPKYLAFAQKLARNSSEDYGHIDQVTFLDKLWDKIVKNEIVIRGNLHEKRNTVFIEVCVRRAKNMTLYTDANNLDGDALLALTNDGVLVKYNESYAPAHDILEDWALIRYISEFRQSYSETRAFFEALGNEPAIRRGFRLWLENEILKSEQDSYVFITELIFNNEIENHWRDETIVAILNSNFCDKFVTENEEVILRNEAELLKKFIHLLRVACKDISQFPKGPGWSTLILCIYKNLDQLDSHYPLILGLILDWEIKIYKDLSNLPKESKATGLIIIQILNSYKNDYNDHINRDHKADQIESAIKLVFCLTEVIEKEVKGLLDETVIILNEPRDKNWQIRGFYEKVIKYTLSGIYCGTLPKYFPDLLIELANLHWKEDSLEEKSPYYSPMGVDHYFGLTDETKLNYNPASASQTFVSKLLLFHPLKAFDFIIEIVNYSTSKYQNSEFSNDDNCIEIEIELDGKVISQQLGSSLLWQMYRGTGRVTPYVLQSLLKALEQYLFNFGTLGTQVAIDNLKFCIDYLMEKSKSVATTSVVASISMAFPKLVGDNLLYLVTNIEFFEWDSRRWMQDQTSGLYFVPFSVDEMIFNEENKNADGWEHRKKYRRGLHGFIIDYQFNVRVLNEKIHIAFDNLEKISKGKDIYWKKILNEIDIRKWKIGEFDKKSGGFPVQPDYKEDVKDMVESFAEEQEDSNKSASYSSWIKKVNEGKEEDQATYNYWNECYDYYLTKNYEVEGFAQNLFDVPGTLAVIGLNQFYSDLKKEQIKWCINTIVGIAEKILDKVGDYRGNFSVNIFDQEPALFMLPKLLGYNESTSDDKEKIKALTFVLLIRMDNEHERIHLIKSIKENLWGANEEFAKSCFIGLITYAEFSNKYQRRHYIDDIKEKEPIRKIEEEIFQKVVQIEFTEIENIQLSYKIYSHWHLDIAVQILPMDHDYPFIRKFLEQLYLCHLDGIVDEEMSHSSNYFEIGRHIKRALGEFLIYNELSKTRTLFEIILHSSYNSETTRYQYKKNEYINETVEEPLYVLDSSWDGENKQTFIDNFWKLWKLLYTKINSHNSYNFTDQFLLKGSWKSTAEHWVPLDAGSIFLKSKIPTLKLFNVNSLIKLLAGLGFKTLVPDGIGWIVKKLSKSPEQLATLDFKSSEKLVEKAFRTYGKEIKQHSQLLNNYIWFLDVLVDMGSSKAYLIRENIVLFKEKKIKTSQ